MLKKFESLGTVLSRDEAKKIVGGLNEGGNRTWCGTCQNNPGGDPYNNTVCVSLSSAWTCINLEGYGGNAMQCGNSSTMGYFISPCD